MEAVKREPIDLSNPDIIGENFMSQAEIDDVKNILTRVEMPIFIGLNGSRSTSLRSPLFPTVEDFETYFEHDVDYVPDEDLDRARELLLNGDFNNRYIKGEKFPENIVHILVRDIDLLIISDDLVLQSGSNRGERTNVSIDVNSTSRRYPLENDSEEWNYYIEGLKETRPLIF